MATKKFIAPDLSNATPTMLLDEMGKLSVMENQIKKLRAVYKEAFYARAGINKEEMEVGDPGAIINEGEIFKATTIRTMPKRFDSTALKETNPEVWEAFTKEGDQLTTRFVLKEGVENVEVNSLLEQMKRELDLDD
jgi:hypothetical protein